MYSRGVATIGTVRELWRFPVKSMGGERLEAADVDARGVRGDRLWALRDEAKGVITSAKKLPALLLCTARYASAPGAEAGPGAVPAVIITLPDGATVRSDDPDVDARLSAALGRALTLCSLRPASDTAHYRAGKATAADMRADFALAEGEPLPDFSMMKMSTLMELGTYATPRGTYFDAADLHVLTTASLAAMRRAAPAADFDVRRFRPNLVIDNGEEGGLVEAAWAGGDLRAGGAAATIDSATPRCSMPIRPQPEMSADPAVLAAIVAEGERCLGAYASVTRAGPVKVGDRVELDVRRSPVGGWLRARATGAKRLLLKAAMPKK